jgi:hypothetical protein
MHLAHSHENAGGAGHNSGRPVSQWQTPHLPQATRSGPETVEADLDLVEEAFIDAFPRAADPTSFLRLAGVPLVGETTDGRKRCLLRVEISQKTDVGSLSPPLGGAGHRYDPLPAKLVSRRQALVLVYFDGENALSLSFGEARALKQAGWG